MNVYAENSTGDAVSPTSPTESAAEADHVTSVGVTQCKPASDVTQDSTSGGGKFTATVHPINVDTTRFVLSVHLHSTIARTSRR